VLGVGEVAVGSAVGAGEGVDFDSSGSHDELFRVQDVENSAGIVNRRKGEFEDSVVAFLKL